MKNLANIAIKIWILFLLMIWAFASFGGLLKLINVI